MNAKPLERHQSESIAIRAANQADLKQLQTWCLHLAEHEEKSKNAIALQTNKDFPEYILIWLKTLLVNEDSFIQIAESNNQSVGFIAYFIQKQLNPFTIYDYHGIVQMLWVEPEYRQRYIASHLLFNAEKVFKSYNINYCDIQFTSGNTQAKHFWQDAGYEISHYNCRKFF